MSERIRSLLDELVKDRETLASKSQPLKDKRVTLQDQIGPLEAEVRDLTEQIRDIEGEELVKLDKSIGSLHKALGAKSMSADSMNAPATEE